MVITMQAVQHIDEKKELVVEMEIQVLDGHHRSLFKKFI